MFVLFSDTRPTLRPPVRTRARRPWSFGANHDPVVQLGIAREPSLSEPVMSCHVRVSFPCIQKDVSTAFKLPRFG